MTEKTFTYVGIATMKNRTKFKYANGSIDARVKSMQRLGFTNIEFVNLPGPMTKTDAKNSIEAQEMARRHNFSLPKAPVSQEAEETEA